MDPNPKTFPILSFVMQRLPTFGPRTAAEYDVEQPDPSSSGQAQSQKNPVIVDQMPHLSDPKLVSAMRRAIHDVYQTRSVLQTLGPRPDHETIDKTKARIVEIDSELAKSLEGIVHSIRETDVDQFEWRVQLSDKEKALREDSAKEKNACKKILELDDMHEAYEKMLKEAEERLVKIYERAENGEEEVPPVREEVNEEVMGLLQEAAGKSLEQVDLSSRGLRFLPEAFGRIAGLRLMSLSNNHLEVIPDSIAGLVNLEELNLASNLLETLPDSIGLLDNLKILDVSGNKLSALPDSISHCRSLVELDASFNRLAYLPTNIGHELVNLQKLLVPLNKIRFLPTSIGEMASLHHLDAHFNELHGLPATIGKLTNLEILNVSSNFTDMKELPETFGELTNLKELDLSNNQIHALPNTFGRLDQLVKLNLEENPMVIPPVEVVKEGVEAVKTFMAKRWLDILLEEERRSMLKLEGNNNEGEQMPTGWLTRSTSWLKTVGENVSGILGGGNSPRDPCLDQQL